MKLSVLTTAGIWSNSLTPKYLWAKWEQNLLLQNKTLSSNLCKYISLFNRLGFLLFIWTMVSFYQPLLYFRQCLMMQFFLTKTHLWLPPKTVRVTQRYLRGQIWEKKKKKYSAFLFCSFFLFLPFSSVHSSYSYLSSVHTTMNKVFYPPMRSWLFYTNVTQLVLILGFSQDSSNDRLRTRVSFATFSLPQVLGHVGVSPGCSLSCPSNKMGSA